MGRSGWEKGECCKGVLWGREPPDTDPPVSACQLPQIPQEKMGSGGGAGVKARIFWPSLYLTVSVPTCSPRSGSGQCLLQPHKSNILSGRCRAVIKRPASGNCVITVITLVLSCQAGTSLATKACLFHDPDSTMEVPLETPASVLRRSALCHN